MSGAPCPGVGPCDLWDLSLPCLDDAGILSGGCDSGEPVDAAIVTSASLSASEMLWALTGRQFGTCTATVRPCRQGCLPCDLPWPATGPWPALIGGRWFNVACGCSDRCSCKGSALAQVRLPNPVCEITEVMVDGVVLDPSSYLVLDYNTLVRTDGSWPLCNDMTLPDTEEGTWSVTLTWGVAVPQLVLDAAAEIACEFIKARTGQPCKLPQRVTTLSRQGVTMSFADPQDFFKDGRTGFYLADMAIRTFNPKLLQRSATIYSLDAPGYRRVTG